MTFKQRLFFGFMFLLFATAIGSVIANGVALYILKPAALVPYCFVLLLVTASSLPRLLETFGPRRAYAPVRRIGR